LCGSRNYPYYPHGRSLEIPKGRGDLKAKLLEGQYEAKLQFPGGCGGAKQKTFVGGVWIFSGTTHSNFSAPPKNKLMPAEQLSTVDWITSPKKHEIQSAVHCCY